MSEPLFYLFKKGRGYYRHFGIGYCDRTEAALFSKDFAQREVVSTHGEVEAIPVDQPEEGSYILASNLEGVLEEELRINADIGFPEDAYHKGLQANLAYLKKHGTLEVRPS